MAKKKHSISQLEFLRLLKKLKRTERLCLLNYLNDNGFNIICSCFHNVLFEDWNLKPYTKNRLRTLLKGKENHMRSLVKKSNSVKKRKKLIHQYGSNPILGVILSTAIPILTSLLFSKK